MASIATLLSNLGMLQKLLGILRKEGLHDEFFQQLIDDPNLRHGFIVWAKSQSLSTSFWEKVSDTAIRVNLDVSSKLPFKGAKVDWKDGSSGWVEVESRENGLYVDNKPVVLHLVEDQKMGDVQGHNLREQLKSQVTLHPNILDALYENTHLIPESWKHDEQGRNCYIYFWGEICRGFDDRLYVRYFCWGGDRWWLDYHWLGSRWDVLHPAAILARLRPWGFEA